MPQVSSYIRTLDPEDQLLVACCAAAVRPGLPDLAEVGPSIDLDTVGGSFPVSGSTIIDGTSGTAIAVAGGISGAAFDFGTTTIGNGSGDEPNVPRAEYRNVHIFVLWPLRRNGAYYT